MEFREKFRFHIADHFDQFIAGLVLLGPDFGDLVSHFRDLAAQFFFCLSDFAPEFILQCRQRGKKVCFR